MVWHSGLLETIRGGLKQTGEEPLFRRLVIRVAQIVTRPQRASWDSRRGGMPSLLNPAVIGATVFSTSEQEPFGEFAELPEPLTRDEERLIGQLLANDPVIQATSREIALDPTTPPLDGASRALSPEAREQFAARGQRSAVVTMLLVKRVLGVVRRVLLRLRSGRGHGIYTTIVEELLRDLYLAPTGGMIWQQLKGDAELAFGENENCGGTALLEELVAYPWLRVPLLVGHSAGAIWICRLLARAQQLLPTDRQVDVILLAPACDFRLLNETIDAASTRIRQIHCFAMSDEHERADRLVPAVYPRSLLYLISGVLEEGSDWPIVGMARFHTAAEPFTPKAFPDIAGVVQKLSGENCVWSIAADGPGRQSNAVQHGAFDDDPATLASVQHLLATS